VSEHEAVIRGGTVIDGSGSPPRRADVAVSDGIITGTICDASFPTTVLTHWGRDRDHGRLPPEHLIQRQTSATARAVGLLDRGVLAPGYRADVNVIDFDRLHNRPPVIRYDLPAGGRRLVQGADGWPVPGPPGRRGVAARRFRNSPSTRPVSTGRGPRTASRTARRRS
jgi:N-acyl-D-aspartate/D-glutamate deacylase